MITSFNKYDSLIKIWKSLPSPCNEAFLEGNFVTPMLNFLGVTLYEQAKDPLQNLRIDKKTKMCMI
jgi:hypothetical protein